MLHYWKKIQDSDSDHMPLKGVLSFKDTSSRIIRLQQKLSEFDYEIFYKKGRTNANADFLSRLPQKSTEECLILTRQQQAKNNYENISNDQNQSIESNDWVSESEDDEDLNYSIEHESSEENLELDNTDEINLEIITDPEEQKIILYDHHDSLMGGHFGADKTYESIKRKYKWKGMKRQVEKYVKLVKNLNTAEKQRCHLH